MDDRKIADRGKKRRSTSMRILPPDGAERGAPQLLKATYAECTRDGYKPKNPSGSGADTKGSKPKRSHGSKPIHGQCNSSMLSNGVSSPRVRRVHVPVTRVRQAAPAPSDTLARTRIAQYAPPALFTDPPPVISSWVSRLKATESPRARQGLWMLCHAALSLKCWRRLSLGEA